jgi:hypothetical protein
MNNTFDDDEIELIELLDELDDDLDFVENDEEDELEDNYPADTYDMFTIQVTLAIMTDNFDYFIKLFSPSFFIDISAKDKFRQTMACIGETENKEKKRKFLDVFIIETEIIKFDFYSCSWDLLKVERQVIDEIFYRREMNKFAKELPIKQIIEHKKTKV